MYTRHQSLTRSHVPHILLPIGYHFVCSFPWDYHVHGAAFLFGNFGSHVTFACSISHSDHIYDSRCNCDFARDNPSSSRVANFSPQLKQFFFGCDGVGSTALAAFPDDSISFACVSEISRALASFNKVSSVMVVSLKALRRRRCVDVPNFTSSRKLTQTRVKCIHGLAWVLSGLPKRINFLRDILLRIEIFRELFFRRCKIVTCVH